MSIFKKNPGGSAAEAQAEAQREEGSALDAETLMRKFDKESNTRIWEGTPAIIVRIIVVAFSLYCIWSTLFSVAALEKRLTMFMALVTIMGYLTYPASRHHVRHNYIPWYDFVLMAVGAGCFLFFCLKYDSLVKVLTSASKMTPTFTIIGIVGLLCLMELCRRCVGIPILCVAGVLLVYTFSTGMGVERVLYTLFYTTGGVLGTPVQVCAKYIDVFIIFHVRHTSDNRIMLVFGTHSEYFFCQKPHFLKNIFVLKQANLPNFVVHSPKPILLIILEITSYFPHNLNGFPNIFCTNSGFKRFLKLRTAFFLFFFRNSKQRVYRRFKK